MKKLISAETIRQTHAAGKGRIEVKLPETIVTAEARTLAEQLGVKLVEAVAAVPVKLAEGAACCSGSVKCDEPGGDEIAAIRAAIVARLPAGCVSDQVIEQLIRKAIDERRTGANPQISSGNCNAGFKSESLACGIKHVQGGSVQFGRFDGAGAGSQVGLTDVITASDHSSMAAGYMTWSNCFFPWTLTYDEIDIVIEGELHIRSEGKKVVGKPGDVIFIPKGSAIEFGTPSSVRFLYVTYPADWQNQ
jgi:ethanolamine utilization protein EutQ